MLYKDQYYSLKPAQNKIEYNFQKNINSCITRPSRPSTLKVKNSLTITLTKEFCAQPLRLVWLIVCTKTELEKDIEYRCIKNLSGFKGFTSDYRS